MYDGIVVVLAVGVAKLLVGLAVAILLVGVLFGVTYVIQGALDNIFSVVNISPPAWGFVGAP